MNTQKAESLLINLEQLENCKGSLGFKIAYNIRKLKEELREYFQFKEDIFRKYGNEVDGNLTISQESENFPLFIKELNELNTDIDISLMKISQKELEESNLTAKEMAMIWEIYDGND